MTDSMKFGPEWLRNMSTDSANTSSVSGSNNNVSGGGGNCSINYHLGNQSSILDQLQTPIPGQRNLFPQFRYGREELLSLFDKNCNMPEILTGYKKLFVDKVQVPLALSPSTDEEIFAQPAVLPTQRPAWVRRSPVGFTTSLRGTGRGGAVDRGRIRGKSIYHPIFQRPTAVYEDDTRPFQLKSERNWSERNGGCDTLGIGNSGSVSVASDWNGTPASSPRKEFPSHSRSMENWRKNRTENGLGEVPLAGHIGADGWRGSTSFGSTHRWGRSTSWRDEDTTLNTTDGYTGSGSTLQRSYSTISTTVNERGAYGNNIALKNLMLNSTSSYGSTNNSMSNRQASNSGPPVGRVNQWTTPTGEIEDNLPEWAMESPSDSGGTFDSSGAFHGSVDDDDPNRISKEYHFDHKKDSSMEEFIPSTIVDSKNDVPQENDKIVDSTIKTKCEETSSREKQHIAYEDNENLSNDKQLLENDLQISEDQNVHSEKEFETHDENALNVTLQLKSEQAPLPNPKTITPTIGATTKQLQLNTSHSDISDHMQEAADHMVEKLIMDDDSIGISNIITSSSNNITNLFVAPAVTALLKQSLAQQHQQVPQNLDISPSVTNLIGHKVMPLFGGGIVVDQATMQQQLAAVSAATNMQSTINPGTSGDLWYYRDPQSKVQGPFTANEMTEWYRAGYFDENLYVRRICDARFCALGDLIKLCHGNMPFTHIHLVTPTSDSVNMISNVVPHRQVRDKTQDVTEFGINQHQEPCEELKGNVMAAADSLSAAVKNLINPADTSHMLNIQFQMLQKQYLQHQEMMVLAEFSSKEGFQRLTPSEREMFVRQKVQMMGLPDYLTSLASLSNSLSILNPSASNQLYDVITKCSKKGQHFPGDSQKQLLRQHQPQQIASNLYLDSDNFILSSQKEQEPTQFSNIPYIVPIVNDGNGPVINATNDDLSTNGMVNDLNLRMLLTNENITSQQSQQEKTQSDATASNDFLTQQQFMDATSQSPVLQMWVSQLGTGNTVLQPHFLPQQRAQTASCQWTSGPLGHVLNSTVSNASIATIAQKKTIPGSMWDVMPVEQVNNPQHFQSNVLNLHAHSHQQTIQEPVSEQRPPAEEPNKSKDTQQLDAEVKAICSVQIPVSNKSLKEDRIEKQTSQQQHNVIKRTNNKQQSSTSKSKIDILNNKKQTEEDRRREIVEEKRRQKEEKKRQQSDEEKRRLQQVEEEKRRQLLEEKERQQQIQAQRRKAILGNAANVATANLNAVKSNKDQKQGQSSIAPWSAQTTAVVRNSGPSLAEIQKAERRERRADQRQMEILEKQIRAANAVGTETNDSFLKWNSSPVPVKSFAEIQAEEAKRLASELFEVQRRKEQEQQSLSSNGNLVGNVNSIGAGLNSTNLSAIWSNSKVWGSTSNSGFWEEPIKFSVALASNNNVTTTVGLSSGKSQTSSQQKSQPSTSATNRNLIKSQTVSTMQHSPLVLSSHNNKNGQRSLISVKQNQKQQQKPNPCTEKKNNTNNQPQNVANNNSALLIKKDDYQNDFTVWCTKILSSMNTKIDVPTFVTFLQDLDSPYEVKDYIRMYLGEGKEFNDFAKQFLERRSKYKNLQRAQNAHNDDMCKPAPAITPSGNDPLDNKGKQKKIKKNKMTKLDARILGFSVTAAEGRINVGDRDYVDA